MLGPLPRDEDRRQRSGREHGRDGVGNVEAHVQHVGCHRAEDADHDHGEPIGPRRVPAHRELHEQRNDQTDEADADRDDGIDEVDEEVRRRLAERGRPALQDPEVDRDLGNPHRQPALRRDRQLGCRSSCFRAVGRPWSFALSAMSLTPPRTNLDGPAVNERQTRGKGTVRRPRPAPECQFVSDIIVRDEQTAAISAATAAVTPPLR